MCVCVCVCNVCVCVLPVPLLWCLFKDDKDSLKLYLQLSFDISFLPPFHLKLLLVLGFIQVCKTYCQCWVEGGGVLPIFMYHYFLYLQHLLSQPDLCLFLVLFCLFLFSFVLSPSYFSVMYIQYSSFTFAMHIWSF